jgi:hypothetical protein
MIIKDLTTLKKYLYNGKISKMKLTYSKTPSVHLSKIREIGKVNDDSFTLKTEQGTHSWFDFPHVSKFSFDNSNKFRIVNGDELLLEYECFCDSEINEDLGEPKFYKKTSIMKELLK